MKFKPTKEQILQAWEDLDEGRPVSKDMQLYLEQLEKREQDNAKAMAETAEWAKREKRANELVRAWDKYHRAVKGEPMPDEFKNVLKRDFRKSL